VFVVFPVSRLRRALACSRSLNSSHPFLQLHCLARTRIYLSSHSLLHLSVIFPLSPPQIDFVADDTPVNRLFANDADTAGRSPLSPLSLVRFLSLSKRPPPPILPRPGVKVSLAGDRGRRARGVSGVPRVCSRNRRRERERSVKNSKRILGGARIISGDTSTVAPTRCSRERIGDMEYVLFLSFRHACVRHVSDECGKSLFLWHPLWFPRPSVVKCIGSYVRSANSSALFNSLR